MFSSSSAWIFPFSSYSYQYYSAIESASSHSKDEFYSPFSALFFGAGALKISPPSSFLTGGRGVFLLMTAPLEPINIAGPLDILNAGSSFLIPDEEELLYFPVPLFERGGERDLDLFPGIYFLV